MGHQFGHFIDFWRSFVILESLIIFLLYGQLVVVRIKLLSNLHTSSARKLVVGSIAKHVGVCSFTVYIITSAVSNWGKPAMGHFGWLIQIAFICFVVAWGLYERAQILIRREP